MWSKKRFSVSLEGYSNDTSGWMEWIDNLAAQIRNSGATYLVDSSCERQHISFFSIRFFFTSEFLIFISFSSSILFLYWFQCFFLDKTLELFQPFNGLKPDLCVCDVVWYMPPSIITSTEKKIWDKNSWILIAVLKWNKLFVFFLDLILWLSCFEGAKTKLFKFFSMILSESIGNYFRIFALSV